jgi:hypothetical protein
MIEFLVMSTLIFGNSRFSNVNRSFSKLGDNAAGRAWYVRATFTKACTMLAEMWSAFRDKNRASYVEA